MSLQRFQQRQSHIPAPTRRRLLRAFPKSRRRLSMARRAAWDQALTLELRPDRRLDRRAAATRLSILESRPELRAVLARLSILEPRLDHNLHRRLALRLVLKLAHKMALRLGLRLALRLHPKLAFRVVAAHLSTLGQRPDPRLALKLEVKAAPARMLILEPRAAQARLARCQPHSLRPAVPLPSQEAQAPPF